MPRVIIPFPLRQYVNHEREVVVEGTSLKETMDSFLCEYPAFKQFNHDTSLLSVFVNSRLVRSHSETWSSICLKNDDEITLIIPIAGG
jgi:molybdopterin converting factor small subunit